MTGRKFLLQLENILKAHGLSNGTDYLHIVFLKYLFQGLPNSIALSQWHRYMAPCLEIRNHDGHYVCIILCEPSNIVKLQDKYNSPSLVFGSLNEMVDLYKPARASVNIDELYKLLDGFSSFLDQNPSFGTEDKRFFYDGEMFDKVFNPLFAQKGINREQTDCYEDALCAAAVKKYRSNSGTDLTATVPAGALIAKSPQVTETNLVKIHHSYETITSRLRIRVESVTREFVEKVFVNYFNSIKPNSARFKSRCDVIGETIPFYYTCDERQGIYSIEVDGDVALDGRVIRDITTAFNAFSEAKIKEYQKLCNKNQNRQITSEEKVSSSKALVTKKSDTTNSQAAKPLSERERLEAEAAKSHADSLITRIIRFSQLGDTKEVHSSIIESMFKAIVDRESLDLFKEYITIVLEERLMQLQQKAATGKLVPEEKEASVSDTTSRPPVLVSSTTVVMHQPGKNYSLLLFDGSQVQTKDTPKKIGKEKNEKDMGASSATTVTRKFKCKR